MPRLSKRINKGCTSKYKDFVTSAMDPDQDDENELETTVVEPTETFKKQLDDLRMQLELLRTEADTARKSANTERDLRMQLEREQAATAAAAPAGTSSANLSSMPCTSLNAAAAAYTVPHANVHISSPMLSTAAAAANREASTDAMNNSLRSPHLPGFSSTNIIRLQPTTRTLTASGTAVGEFANANFVKNIHPLSIVPSERAVFGTTSAQDIFRQPEIIPAGMEVKRSMPYALGVSSMQPAPAFGQHMAPHSTARNFDLPVSEGNTLKPYRKLYDLPEFDGSPEDWPMFATSLTESTSAYGYSNLENSLRLQRCLKGVAKETVRSLLIHPDNVWEAFRQLETCFGRHDILIKSQIRKAKDIPPITEGTIEQILPFAVKTRNLATFLQAAKGQQHIANPTLLEELVSKLPMSRRIEWVQHAFDIQPYPTVVDFSRWLDKLASYISMVTSTKGSSERLPKTRPEPAKRHLLHTSENVKQNISCVFCYGEHNVVKCPELLSLSVSKRWNAVKDKKLCFCCLAKGHSSAHCRSKKYCRVQGCQRKHHPLLHEAEEHKPDQLEQTKAESVLSVGRSSSSNRTEVLFRIVPVILYGRNTFIETYALLDEGSSTTLVDESLSKYLGLKGKSNPLTLQWVKDMKMKTEPSTTLDLQISGRGQNPTKFTLRGARTVKDICLPTQTLDLADLGARYQSLKKLPLRSYVNAKPLILIGVDNCHLGLPRRIREFSSNGPVVAKTKLGWVVFGPTSTTEFVGCGNAVCLYTKECRHEQLEKMVSEYFTTENFGVKKPESLLESAEDARARRILSETTVKVGDRFQAGLLWKSDKVELPTSYEMAKKRLLGIEKKMRRDSNFASSYMRLMDDYIVKGYARQLTPKEKSVVNGRTWYLPHFGVRNPNKPNKLRLVFDAAAVSGNISLNANLLKGPDEYKPLPSVLFNFRMNNVAVCADIREMFHQILIRPEDRCAQRFLWRWGDESKPIDVFEMVAMTFGATCSPCIAHHVKNLNARHYSQSHPRAVKSIIHHHYVDDFVDSFSSENEAIQVSTAVKSIHKAAGFELRNFVSNSKEVANVLNGAKTVNDFAISLDKDTELAAEKILGMYWRTSDDTFTFNLNFHRIPDDVLSGIRPPTKRELLSIAMSIFDPFGLLANIMVFIKIILQELWSRNIEWDEPIPEGLYERWYQWKHVVSEVDNLRISRRYFSAQPVEIQLHVFVDASEDAFSAVAYWRYVSIHGVVVTSFIAGKTKCAPRKQLSVPRLELQSAVLGTRLQKTILEQHAITIAKTFFWSDSKTVLSWIRSDNRRYKPFVAHRVSEILESTKAAEWRWIPTGLNVADDATRAVLPAHFDVLSRWLLGPDFLKKGEEFWPCETTVLPNEDCLEELKPKFLLLIKPVSSPINVTKFSDYLRLKRVVAFTKRYVRNWVASHRGTPINRHSLTTIELDEAEVFLCRAAQLEAYGHEIGLIQRQMPLPNESALRSLCPYLDEDGILRLYGRIDAASTIPQMTRRPIILPKRHALTTLIVAYYHKRLRHQNDEVIVNEIRQRFWIPHLRQLVRRAKQLCQYCKVRSAIPATPMMGQLPKDRLTPFIRPFTYSGVDYFGPLHVAVGRRREKRWVAIFTCLTVRAVHLELAADLSTDSFILCLRNFVNRRGVPVRIRSDNGTNFVGANGELSRFNDVFDESRVQAEMSSRHIQWIFNCPANPSAGGAWERMVQSVKRVLSYSLKEEAPRVETLRSYLIEAENIVNSRPLTHLPITVEEEEPLTPNHFLLGTGNSTQTPGTADKKLHCLRKQWRISQQLKDRFWKRWLTEFLPTLTRRSKWCDKVKPLEVGDLVFVCDVDMPRNKWRRGRIIKVFSGADGQVRTAEVQTIDGIFRRPALKLALLDVQGGESEDVAIHGRRDVAESRMLNAERVHSQNTH